MGSIIMKLHPLAFAMTVSGLLFASMASSANDDQPLRKRMTLSPDNALPAPAAYCAEAEHAFIDTTKFYGDVLSKPLDICNSGACTRDIRHTVIARPDSLPVQPLSKRSKCPNVAGIAGSGFVSPAVDEPVMIVV